MRDVKTLWSSTHVPKCDLQIASETSPSDMINFSAAGVTVTLTGGIRVESVINDTFRWIRIISRQTRYRNDTRARLKSFVSHVIYIFFFFVSLFDNMTTTVAALRSPLPVAEDKPRDHKTEISKALKCNVAHKSKS